MERHPRGKAGKDRDLEEKCTKKHTVDETINVSERLCLVCFYFESIK